MKELRAYCGGEELVYYPPGFNLPSPNWSLVAWINELAPLIKNRNLQIKIAVAVAHKALEKACQGCAAGFPGKHDLCNKLEPVLDIIDNWLKSPNKSNLDAWKVITNWDRFNSIWIPHWTVILSGYQDPMDCIYHAAKIVGREVVAATVLELTNKDANTS